MDLPNARLLPRKDVEDVPPFESLPEAPFEDNVVVVWEVLLMGIDMETTGGINGGNVEDMIVGGDWEEFIRTALLLLLLLELLLYIDDNSDTILRGDGEGIRLGMLISEEFPMG